MSYKCIFMYSSCRKCLTHPVKNRLYVDEYSIYYEHKFYIRSPLSHNLILYSSLHCRMSPERRSSNDGGGPALESSNVIFSAIAHESSHVLLHPQQPPHNQPAPLSQTMNNIHQIPQSNHLQHQQQQLLHQNGVSVTSVHNGATATNGHHSITTTTHHLANDSYATVMTLSSSASVSSSSGASSLTTTMANSTTTSASKLLVLHPNQLNDSFKSCESHSYGVVEFENNCKSISFLGAAETQAVGNIVLVATEPMDFVSTDTLQANNGHPKVTIVGNSDEELTPLNWLHDKNLLRGINLKCSTSAASKPSPDSPAAHTTPGSGYTSAQDSPQRLSSQSPTSDYMDDSYVSEENAPSANSSDQGISIYESPSSNGHSEHTSHIAYTVTSHPATTVVYTTSSQHNNNNSTTFNRNTRPPPQPQVIRISPGDTVFEYKTANLHSKINAALQSSAVTSVSTPASMFNERVVLSNGIASPASSANATSSPSSTTTTTSSVMHFHKKYLREEHQKAMKQIPQGSPVKPPPAITIPTGHLVYHQGSFSPNAFTPGTVQTAPSPDDTSHHHSPLHQPAIQTSPVDLHQHLHLDDFPPNDESTASIKMQYSRSELSSPDSFISPATSPHSTPSKQCTNNTNPATAASPQKPKHPSNLPYDPLVHTANKPPLSFSSLIFLAIDDSLDKALPVKEIYAWIVSHYPYFKSAPTGWKNSVRHNLSLNKCFQKVEKAPVSQVINTLPHQPFIHYFDLDRYLLGLKRFLQPSNCC